MKSATAKKFRSRCYCVNCYQTGNDKRRDRAVRQMLKRDTREQAKETATENKGANNGY